MSPGVPSSLSVSPVFLVGSERSGTTLLRLMLDHHPRLSFFSEFEFAVSMIDEEGRWPPIPDYIDFLQTNRNFRVSGLKIDRELDYPHLVDSFLCQIRKQQGKQLVGATVHHAFDRLLAVWPDARFIHLLRDGRDVARSAVEMGWAGNVAVACDIWIRAELLWQRMEQVVPSSRRISVRYEDLVASPVDVLTRVCSMIGIPYDAKMLTYPDDSTYGPPSQSSIGKAARELPSRDLQRLETRIGAMLEERGYPRSGLAAVAIGPMEDRWLRLHSRWAALQFRRRRFGLGLLLAESAARRLGFTGAAERAQLRMQDIQNRHVK